MQGAHDRRRVRPLRHGGVTVTRLLILGVLALVGVGAWQIGNRLSTDAVGMGIGLVFGVLAGLPAALLVLATGRHARTDDADGDAWDAGYRTGMRETTALALGTRPQLEQHDGRTIDGSLATHYSVARPFTQVER